MVSALFRGLEARLLSRSITSNTTKFQCMDFDAHQTCKIEDKRKMLHGCKPIQVLYACSICRSICVMSKRPWS